MYKYLATGKPSYRKKFAFQTGHSTEQGIVKLANKIYEPFERKQYTLGVFVNLTEAFDTVSHLVLIKKLQRYGIRGINLACFHRYLANSISLGHDLKTDTQNILCGDPQGSILRLLVFLLYVNDLPTSPELDPIMFSEDTNLVFEYTDL